MSDHIGRPVRLRRTIDEHARQGSPWIAKPSEYNPDRVNLYKVTKRTDEGPVVWRGLMILEVHDDDIEALPGWPESMPFTT